MIETATAEVRAADAVGVALPDEVVHARILGGAAHVARGLGLLEVLAGEPLTAGQQGRLVAAVDDLAERAAVLTLDLSNAARG